MYDAKEKNKRNKNMQNKRLIYILIRLTDYTDFVKVGGPI